MIYTPAVGRQTKFYGSAIDAKTDRLGSRRTRSRLILVRPQQRRAETTADLEHPAAPGQHPRLVLYSDQSAADSQPKRPFLTPGLNVRILHAITKFRNASMCTLIDTE